MMFVNRLYMDTEEGRGEGRTTLKTTEDPHYHFDDLEIFTYSRALQRQGYQ